MKGKAQYPFGYGLNYGKTQIRQARLEEDKVFVTVENEGESDTDEVVQIYIRPEESEFAVPNPQLCAFKRISVKAGDRLETELTLPPRAFTVVNEKGERFTPGGLYRLYVGFGQPDERTRELTGREPVVLEKRI